MPKKVKAVRYCVLAVYNNREKKIEFNVNFFSKKILNFGLQAY